MTETFAARLHALRVEAGVSVYELARRTGIDRQYLRRLESGEKDAPSLETARKIAAALGKNLSVWE